MTSSHPQGSEEKDGSGKCSCKRGYEGDTCQQCAKGFFNDTEEEEFTCEGWFRLEGKHMRAYSSIFSSYLVCSSSHR